METINFSNRQTEAMIALQSEKYRFIMFGGAIGGGKTVWGLGALLVLCELFPRSRWCVIRETIERIRITTIPSLRQLRPSGKIKGSPFEYHHPNGSIIMFKGESYAIDKDNDWMKGLEVNGFLFEEINECQQQTFLMAFQRVGRWKMIPMPKPIILATCNPSFGWVKDLIYDRWKNNVLPEKWLFIPSRVTDNPHLTVDYLENLKSLPKYEYEVFVEGNWDIQLKTGGEFFKGFELAKHLKPVRYNEDSPVHISVDSNVFPYIAITFWQIEEIDGVSHIIEIDEMPCRDPYNTARQAGRKIIEWLRKHNYNKKVFIYGDCSTQNRNNIDDDKLSFIQIIINEIKNEKYIIQNRMLKSNPNVSNVADFINAILSGEITHIDITIGEHCKLSINDYIDVKQDKNGGMLKRKTTDPKTGVLYEPIGHFSDNFKDLVVQAFHDDFIRFNDRFKKLQLGGIEQVKMSPKYTF